MKFFLIGTVAIFIIMIPVVLLVFFMHKSADLCIKSAATKSYPEWGSKMRADPKNKEIKCLFSKTLATEPYRCFKERSQRVMFPTSVASAFVKLDPYVKGRINSWPKLNVEHNKICAMYPESLIEPPLLN